MDHSEMLINVGTAYDKNTAYGSRKDNRQEAGAVSFDSVFREFAADSAKNPQGTGAAAISGASFSAGGDIARMGQMSRVKTFDFDDEFGISDDMGELDEMIGLDELEELDKMADEKASALMRENVPVSSAADELSSLMFADGDLFDGFEGIM